MIGVLPVRVAAAGGVIDAAGPITAAQTANLGLVGVMVALVIVPLFLGLPIILWRYRLARPGGAYRPDWEFSRSAEVAIWGLPAAVVAALAVNLWYGTHRLDPSRAIVAPGPPVAVQVVALDWKFVFLYPREGIATVNRLVIPAGRDIAFTMTSDATMQSLLIPRLGGQVYVMAGMATHLHVLADRPGIMRGLNAQYNGAGFAAQNFAVDVLNPRDYARWTVQMRHRPALSDAAYQALSQPSARVAPRAYGGAPPDLFGRIIAKYSTMAQAPR